MTRKTLGFAFLILFGITVGSQAAFADPLPAVNDMVTLSGGNGINGGGIFNLTKSGVGGYTIPVFCVENMEFISLGTPYRISDISQNIYRGGTGTFATLDYRVDYLFFLWDTGALPPGLYNGSAQAQADLQAAIWYLQYGTGGANAIAQHIINLNPANQDHGTRVINLQDSNGNNKQSQLFRPQTVPEPSSLALVGLGLLGLVSVALWRNT